MAKFTVFVQASDRTGTVWIETIEAKDVGEAMVQGVERCAEDWGCGVDVVDVIGVAEGEVKILFWDDE